MKGFRQTALAGALVLAAGFAPASAAQGQSAEGLVRAVQIGGGSRIGVTVEDIEDTDAKDAKLPRAGVLIETVNAGGPADKAGMKTGDAITDFDGEKVRSVRQFSRLVQETPYGRTVAVVVARGGQRVTLNVTTERSSYDDFSMRLLNLPMIARPVTPTLPTPPAPPAAPRAARPPLAPLLENFGLSGGRRLGVRVETLDDQLAQYFGVKEGALVRSVDADSAAQKAGVKAGDVITGLNGRQIYEAPDVNRAIDRMDSTDDFTVEIVRDRKPMTLKGKLEARTRTRGTL